MMSFHSNNIKVASKVMKQLKYLHLWKLISLLMIFATFFVCLMKAPSTGVKISHLDKIAHFMIYFSLIVWNTQVFEKRNFKFLIFFLFLMGLLIEIIQYFLPWRSFEWQDLGVNILGTLIGYFFIKDHHHFLEKLEERLCRNL